VPLSRHACDTHSVAGVVDVLPHRIGNIGNKRHTDLDLYIAILFFAVALLVNPSQKLGEQRRENLCVAWHREVPFVPDVPAGRERREEERIGLSGTTKRAQSQA
jgi:hypothetical protein